MRCAFEFLLAPRCFVDRAAGWLLLPLGLTMTGMMFAKPLVISRVLLQVRALQYMCLRASACTQMFGGQCD
jgi:hypothetical protein